MEIFSASQLEITNRARFISLITSLEALSLQKDYKEYTEHVKDKIDDLILAIKCEDNIPEKIRCSLIGKIKREMSVESVRQAILDVVLKNTSDTSNKKLFDEAGSVFIDARKQHDYANSHIPGALNFYAEEFGIEEEKSITGLLPFDTMIIAYCDGGECELSRRLAERLGEIGYTKVRILVVGWGGWKKAGYPVER